MTIKQLNAEDVGSFRKIRLEALDAYPEAFGSSYAEELEYSIAAIYRCCRYPKLRWCWVTSKKIP